MKIFIRGAVAALALSLVGVTGAEAQLFFGYSTQSPAGPLYADAGSNVGGTNYYAGTSCTSGDVAGSVACDGWFEGNNDGMSPPPEGLVIEHINYIWAAQGLGTVTSGSTTQVNGGATGTINLGTTISGFFALAMKAGEGFMLALVDGGAAGVSSVDYNMTSSPFSGQGLSHFTVYGGGGTSVPEPTTLFLLGTGLLGMGFVVWRRREEVLA